MAVNVSEISRFRWLVVWLADNMVSEDIQKARTLLKDKLGPRYEEIGDDALKLFDALERENLIHDEDTQLLRVLLESLERIDLLEDLDEYETERKAVIRRLNKNASLLEGSYVVHYLIWSQQLNPPGTLCQYSIKDREIE